MSNVVVWADTVEAGLPVDIDTAGGTEGGAGTTVTRVDGVLEVVEQLDEGT